MVNTRTSMLPGAKKVNNSNLAFKIMMNKIDAFSEKFGFPAEVMKRHTAYENALLDKHKGDKDSFKSMLRTNRPASPYGKYIKSWVSKNKQKAIDFLK
jgi:hypothetical protein